MRVVMLVSSEIEPTATIAALLGGGSLASMFPEGTRLDLISWTPAQEQATPFDELRALGGTPPAALDRALHALGVGRLHRLLGRNPIGRLLNSFGPADQGRVFWRRLRRDEVALGRISQADAIIAVDLPAVKAAWHLLRRRRVERAFFGLRAGAEALSR